MSFRSVSVAAGAFLLLFGCAADEPAGAPEMEMASALPACEPDNGGLTLPAGFCALVVADNIGRARHLDVASNGDIYVRDRGNRGRDDYDPGGGIIALRDADGDGRAETMERFADHYGTGLQLRGDHLYTSTTTEVYRYPMTAGELLPTGDAELIVGGFPEQRGHSGKAFAFDDAGYVYVNVGAPSNACMEQARTRGSMGQAPCEQLVRQASVWRFDAATPGQTQEADGHQFVRGTRNIVGIAWDPASRAIYAVQHGRDALGSLWDYGDEDNAEIPSEEFFRLRDGANFGWPYCYHDRFQGKRLLAPEYGGDGTEVGRLRRVRRAARGLPGSLGARRHPHSIPVTSSLHGIGRGCSSSFTAPGTAPRWNRADIRWRSPRGTGVHTPATGRPSPTDSRSPHPSRSRKRPSIALSASRKGRTAPCMSATTSAAGSGGLSTPGCEGSAIEGSRVEGGTG